MKNIFLYYYNMDVKNIINKNNNYTFSYNFEDYVFLEYKRNIKEIDVLYNISNELFNKGIPVHNIIKNKDNSALTNYDNKLYILLKINIVEDRLVNFLDINYFLNNSILIKDNSIINKSNWGYLWSIKNDYLEYQISELGINYKLLVNSFSYFIGISENAISYFNSIRDKNYNLYINHKKLNTLFDLYNPLEFIIDSRSRDIAEYIKYVFYNNYSELWNEVYKIFNSNLLVSEIKLIYSRLLYQTIYFKIYDDIINGTINENNIIDILDKTNLYEEFLSDLYYYIIEYNYIDKVDWLLEK